MIRYKLSGPGNDFWSWVFAIVSKQEGNERNRCIVWFLLADALGRRDDRGVCVLFEQCGGLLNTLSFNQKRVAEIEAVFKRTGKHHLIGAIHAKAI
jgi:hypothetical protein